jgi:hypothetical protein
MKAIGPISAALMVLCLPTRLLACGGCTDAVLLMTLPWAGFGALFLWVWVLTMLAIRWWTRRRGAVSAHAIVRGSTLATFAVLGSVGYVLLAFLCAGSLLLPSLLVGFVWAVYMFIRFGVDLFRLAYAHHTEMRLPVLMHSVFILVAIAFVMAAQAKANSLEHYLACLGYGRHTAMYAKVMPGIVAHGPDAVRPLIQATNDALENDDTYTQVNTVVNATFCLAQIGGPESEAFLSALLRQRSEPSDFVGHQLLKAACFAYSRCAGPRAVNELITVFERRPTTKDSDDRWIPLVALVITGSKQGVAFALDHMELLLRQMESGGDGNEMRVVQSALECLVMGSDPKALTEIPVYRDCQLMGATWYAEPRPDDYNSEFFWIASSEARLHPSQELALKWKENSASICKRWAELLE